MCAVKRNGLTRSWRTYFAGNSRIFLTRLHNRLCLEPGQIVTRHELSSWCFGHRADGGPSDAGSLLSVGIWSLRSMGWPIVSHGCRGYSMGAWHEPLRVRASTRRR